MFQSLKFGSTVSNSVLLRLKFSSVASNSVLLPQIRFCCLKFGSVASNSVLLPQIRFCLKRGAYLKSKQTGSQPATGSEE